MEDFGANPNRNRLYDLVGTIGITFLIWGGNLQIDKFLNKKIGWEGKYVKRISIQLSVTLVYSFLVIYFAMDLMNTFLCEVSAQREKFLLKSAIIVGLLVTLVILSIEVGVQFFYQWKKTLIEVENYKMENVQSQLQNLKNQMNPHFLFNNLSVLTSLVYQDQDKAVDFIQQLSKVYRYILEKKNNELVTVEEEILTCPF